MDRLTGLATRWPGVKFAPDEEQLVRFYYHPKLTQMDFDPDVIPLIKLYEHTPQELIDMYPAPTSPNQAYYFTERIKINPADTDFSRTAKMGVWVTGGERINVFDQNDVVMAVKRRHNFVTTAPGKAKSTDWIMMEYSLDRTEHENIPSHLKDRYVLCIISKKPLDKPPEKWQGQPAVHLALAAGAGQPAVGAGQPAGGAAVAEQPAVGAAGAGQPAVHPAVAAGMALPAGAGQPAVHPAGAAGMALPAGVWQPSVHPAGAAGMALPAGVWQPSVHPAGAAGMALPAGVWQPSVHPAGAAGMALPAGVWQPFVHPAVAAGMVLPAGVGQPAVGVAGAGQPDVGAVGAREPTADLNEGINLGGDEKEDKSPVSKRAKTG